MSKAYKLLQQKQNNPLDWRIENLKTIASAFNSEWHIHYQAMNRNSSPIEKPQIPLGPEIY